MPLRIVVGGENGRSRARASNAPIAWAASYTGPRQDNQDYYGRADHETPGYDWRALGCLYVLADGMGGLASGAQAARIAVKDVIEHYKHSRSAAPVAQSLTAAIEGANRKIYSAGQGNNGRMGSTIVACVLKNGRATVAHAGDSRAYLLRDGQLFRCTTDHLYATEVLGIKDDDDAKKSSEGHKITRALGKDAEIKVDTDENEYTPDDRFLLCSDGISEALQDVEIKTCLAEPTPQKAVQALIASAGMRLTDNATAVVVFASGQKLRRQKTVRRVSYATAAILLLAVGTLAGYKYGGKGIARLENLASSWTDNQPAGPVSVPTNKADEDGRTEVAGVPSGDHSTMHKERFRNANGSTTNETSGAARRSDRETHGKTASAADSKNTALPAGKQADSSWRDHEIDTTQPSPVPVGGRPGVNSGRTEMSTAAQPPSAPPGTSLHTPAATGASNASSQTSSAMSTHLPPTPASSDPTRSSTQRVLEVPKPSNSGQPSQEPTRVPRPPEQLAMGGNKDQVKTTGPSPTSVSATQNQKSLSAGTASQPQAVESLTITNERKHKVDVWAKGYDTKSFTLTQHDALILQYSNWPKRPDGVCWREHHAGGVANPSNWKLSPTCIPIVRNKVVIPADSSPPN